jgi:hypothetical protein
MDLKTIKGDFVTFTTDSLSLSVKGDPVTLKQGDVYRVMSRERSHRGRNALIGAAIGAGILAPLSYVGCQIGGDNPSAGCTAAGTSIGAGIGAGLGSLNAGYQTIYRAKHRTEKLGRVALAEKVPHSVEPLRLKSPSAPSAGVIPYRLR